jgi:hypothetical protein
MLISLIALVVALLSWLSSGVEHVASPHTVPLIAPQDPSSLTLALIGAGMLGAYVLLSRNFRRRGRSSAAMRRVSDSFVEAAGTMPLEEHHPTRGAA